MALDHDTLSHINSHSPPYFAIAREPPRPQYTLEDLHVPHPLIHPLLSLPWEASRHHHLRLRYHFDTLGKMEA